MGWTVAEPSQAPMLILVALLLAIVLLTLELRAGQGRGRRRRIVRAGATLGCVVALLFLLLRPGLWLAADPRAGLLFTAGSPRQADAVVPTTPKQPALRFSLTDSPLHPAPGPFDAQPIPDTAYLARHFSQLRRLTVVGHGLESWQLDALPARIQTTSVPPPSAGLERVSWRRSSTLGDPWRVQGLWGAGGAGGRLELVGAGGVVASQEIPPAEEPATFEATLPVPFSFIAKPRTVGPVLYRLRFQPHGSDLRAPGDIPLEVLVHEVEPPRLLWLESAPRFETRHLKNWLASSGGQLALRTTISRDRFRRERLGSGAQAPARLSSENLREFDLLVVDGAILASLSAPEVRVLKREMSEFGLGVLLLPFGDRKATASRLRQLNCDFPTTPVGDLQEIAVRLAWPGRGPAKPVPALTIPARQLEIHGAMEPMLFDTSGRALVARTPLGVGYCGTTLLPDTFRWILEGAAPTHHRYWSHLLSNLARPASAQRWDLPPGPALLDQPMEVTLWSTRERPSAELVTPTGERLSVALTPLDQPTNEAQIRRWRGRIWPRQTGWHRLISAQDDTAAAFYGQPHEPWRQWLEARRRQSTALRVRSDAALTDPPTTAPLQRQRRPLARWPAYLLFLACLSYLWTDEKLRG